MGKGQGTARKRKGAGQDRRQGTVAFRFDLARILDFIDISHIKRNGCFPLGGRDKV